MALRLRGRHKEGKLQAARLGATAGEQCCHLSAQRRSPATAHDSSKRIFARGRGLNEVSVLDSSTFVLTAPGHREALQTATMPGRNKRREPPEATR